MSKADEALDAAAIWLTDHRWIACALLCALILVVFYLDAPR